MEPIVAEIRQARAGIVVPVYDGLDALRACLASLTAHTAPGVPVVLVDDASPDVRILPTLHAFARERPGTRVVERARNGGFARAVNAGVEQLPADVDFVVLNADAEVTPGWLDALARAIDASPGAGVACPLSNNATILSAPRFAAPGPLSDGVSATEIAAWLAGTGTPQPPWLPTAVGFCMYVTRAAWTAAGPLDVAFGRGYGEECDFSLRVRARGLHVVAATDTFVAHRGAGSFGTGAETSARRRVAEALMNARWPAYRHAVATFLAANPLRERLEAMQRWMDERTHGRRRRILHVVHRWGRTGGVENVVRALATLAPGEAEHVVVAPRPGPAVLDWEDLERAPGLRAIGLPVPRTPWPAHALALADDPETVAAFGRALHALDPDVVHVHHVLGWNTLGRTVEVRRAGYPVLLSLHDYVLLCPNYNFARAHGRPCEKARFDAADAECGECLTQFTGVPAPAVERLDLRDFRARAVAAIEAADRVVTPSAYARDRYARGLAADLAARIEVIGFDGLAALSSPVPPPASVPGAARTPCVAFLGAFSFAKGADIFVAAARRLAGRMRFAVIGPVDPAYASALRDLGIEASGPYTRDQLPSLLAGADVVCVLSRWEETWGFTLDEALASGRRVVATRTGAWIERARGQDAVTTIPPSDHIALIAALERVATLGPLAQTPGRPIRLDSTLAWREVYGSLARRVRVPTGLATPEAALLAANDRVRRALPPAGAPIDVALGDPAYAGWIAAIARWTATAVDAQADAVVAPCLLVLVVGDAERASLTCASLTAGVARCVLPADARAVNAALVASAADWVALIQAGDRLGDDVVAMVRLHGDGAHALIFDDDLATLAGARYAPRFKPAFDPAFIAAQPELLDGACLFRRATLLAGGGYRRADVDANADVALALAAVHGARAIRRIPRIGAHRLDAALMERRLGQVMRTPGAIFASDPLAAVATSPSVARPREPTLTCALRLDAGGTRAEAFVGALLAQTGIDVVAIVPFALACDGRAASGRWHPRMAAPETYEGLADALNAIASRSRTDVLLVATERAWPAAQNVVVALASACVDDVVLAAPRLVGPDGVLVAAGEVIGAGPAGIAGPRGQGVPAHVAGYLLELHTARRAGAVGADFVAIDRCALGGPAPFDAGAGDDFVLADFCLRALERGQHAWVDPALTVHVTPCRRAPDAVARAASAEAMRGRWGAALADDPFHHPHRPLGLPHAPFDAALVVPWHGYPKRRPRVVAAPFDAWGSGQYRVRVPLAALAAHGVVDATLLPGHERGFMPTVTEVVRAGADTVFAHHPFHDYHLAALAAYRRAGGIRIVVGVDDLLDALPAYNPYARTIYPDIGSRIRRALACADVLVVSTEALAEAYGGIAARTVVIPNGVDPDAWPDPPWRPKGGRLRVGWAGGAQHQDDLALIAPVVAATCHEVEWMFLGMAPTGVPAGAVDVRPMVSFELYPAALADLGLDVGVAPLVDNAFNAAKSGVKLVEYGMLGIAALSSERRPYRDAPCRRVGDDPAAWIDAIRACAQDRDVLRAEGKRLRAWALREFSIEALLPRWRETLIGSP